MRSKTLEMFPAEAVQMDSPRLAWMKRHQVLTFHLPSTGEWLAGFVAGENYAKIAASKDDTAQWFCDETSEYGDSGIGIGATEDEALSELLTTWYARSHGIRLWNEEPFNPATQPSHRENPPDTRAHGQSGPVAGQ